MDRACLIREENKLIVIHIDDVYMYQFTALIYRLHKEVSKLTVTLLPSIPEILLECSHVDVTSPHIQEIDGLTYINQLESRFKALQETTYPLISLLTEIRAFQAQLEFLQEERD